MKAGRAAVDQTGYAAAGRFTVADISLGYALTFATRLGETALLTPAIQAYADRLRSRPAYQAVMASDPKFVLPQTNQVTKTPCHLSN